MYEYLSDLERWKNINNNYKIKYNEILDFVSKCENENKNNENIHLCKKPIYDVEKFNADIAKRLTFEIYELCLNKVKSDTEYNAKIESCVDILYRENEVLVKREIMDRLDDVLKFLNVNLNIKNDNFNI